MFISLIENHPPSNQSKGEKVNVYFRSGSPLKIVIEALPSSEKLALGKLINPLIPWLFFVVSEEVKREKIKKGINLREVLNTYKFYLKYGTLAEGMLK